MMRFILLSLCLLMACGQSEDKIYRVGLDPLWIPVDLLGQQNAVSLFSTELTQEIGRVEGFGVSVYELEGHALGHQLRQGELQGILTSIPPLTEFRKYYDFSDVYLYVGPVLVVPEGSPVKVPGDLAGKTVGVVTGWTDVLVAKISEVVINRYPSEIMVLQALYENKIDGAMVAAIPTYAYVRDLYQGKLKVVTPPLTNDGLRLVVLKGQNQDLLDAFNRGLREVSKKSDYDKLAKRWQLNLDQGPAGQSFSPIIVQYWQGQ